MMKLVHRAAVFATVTFCAGALADAATLDPSVVQNQPIQELNAPDPVKVPPQQDADAALAATRQAATPALADAQEYATLSAAVAAQDMPSAADRELNCLAVGVYYEAKGEPLSGQLAVAEVILDRSTSGRFPRSVCSVIKQRGQFSFVRGGKLPTPPANAAWRKAMAVAQVAQKDLWASPVDGALYFHARYVRPSWKRARIGEVGNHVFYR
jgi:spore germination cell wall hydrolase CwlJ-like protein